MGVTAVPPPRVWLTFLTRRDLGAPSAISKMTAYLRCNQLYTRCCVGFTFAACMGPVTHVHSAS